MPLSRRPWPWLLAALLLLALAPTLRPATATARGADRPADTAPQQVLVAFNPRVPEAARDAIVGRRGGRTIQRLDSIHARLIELPASHSRAAAIAALRGEPEVRYAQPNYIYRLDAAPDDASYGQLWGLDNTGQNGGTPDADIDAPEAWGVTTGSADVVVGVVDTGILYTHPDLAANIWTMPAGKTIKGCGAGTRGYRNSPQNGLDPPATPVISCDPIDENSHGTHVAGTIGAVGNNAQGVVGVNWSVKLMALRFFNDLGYGTTAGAIDVIDFAIQAKKQGVNIRILNNSWTNTVHDQALLDQIDAAAAEGILVVAAAGNGGDDRLGDDNAATPIFPANYGAPPYNRPNVIAVAATDRNDTLAGFSNYGLTRVHLGAPGVNTYSTVIPTAANANSYYGSKSGTSMAAPHVAGSAALILAAPGLGNLGVAALRDRLLYCGDPLPALRGTTLTGKRLNVDRAIRDTGGCSAPATNPAPTIAALSPASVAAGGSGFPLTVNGTGFVAGSIVRWNGLSLDTTYVSATQLAATVPAARVAAVGTADVTVFNPPPVGGESGAAQFTINRASQTIAFTAPADKTYGDPAFAISATASSGLPVSLAVSGNCSIGGTTVTITGAGSCTVTASQAGNATYDPATPVSHTFAIAQAPLTIAAQDASRAYGAANPTLTAAYSGFVLGQNSGALTGTLTCSTTATASSPPGGYPITCTGQTSANYAIGYVAGTLTVATAPTTVVVPTVVVPVGATSATLGATLSSTVAVNGGTVTFTVSQGATTYGIAPSGTVADGSASVAFDLSGLGAGRYTVAAAYDGTATFAAGSGTGILQIGPLPQTISFDPLPERTYGDPALTLSATASSGLTVAFSVPPDGPCTLSGATLTIVGAGTCAVTADQPGDAYYDPAPSVLRQFTIARAPQTITLTPNTFPQRTLGDSPVAVSASATSGLPVTLAAGPGGVCALSGGAITLQGVGTCTVTASRAEGANYLAAPDVVRSFQIVAPAPTYSLALAQAGGGAAAANPGPGQHPAGTEVTLTATPNPGQLFTGWLVDGTLRSYANPAVLVLSGNRSVAPTFAARPSFSDVPQGSVGYEAISQLAARGVIRGYAADGCAARGLAAPCFGPNDRVTRAEMATLIARAMGWEGEVWPNPFVDGGGIAPALWNSVATLAHYGVAFGYDGQHFGPNDRVTYAQTLSFISRAMVVKGYWQKRTAPPDPAPYGGVLAGTGHQDDVATFLYYTSVRANLGGVPDHPASGGFADWSSPSSRGWFARALWAALRSQYDLARIP